jgi:fumarylacetoacetate (FAA) hydrolase family protein
MERAEPELALVINAAWTHIGCTIGNDMSSRDIEARASCICASRVTIARARWVPGSASV